MAEIKTYENIICDVNDEDNMHLFFQCPKSILVWQRIGIWNELLSTLSSPVSFPAIIFDLLHHLDVQQKQLFWVTLWSLWNHKNNKVWNDTTLDWISHVEFNRRQTNRVAHELARVALSNPSAHIIDDVRTCI